MKVQNHLRILFLPILLLFLQSCGEDKPTKGKDQPIAIATVSDMTSIEPQEVASDYAYEGSFEDETRSQTNTYDQNTYLISGYANYSVSYTSTASPTQKQIKRGKKIIKNGTMRIKADAFNASKKHIDQVLKSLNGYYENEELDKNDSLIQYRLIIRLPSKNFEQLIRGVENGKDEIVFKKIYTNDVTEEFLDIETRLENKRKYLKRYKELLEKAKNVNEILSIEENIRQLMEEIESKEGRLKYLNDQVDLSTLQINLFKEYPVKIKKQVQDPFSSRAGDSLGKGWDSIIQFLLWSVSKWPLILILGVLTWIVRRKWKKRKIANNQ